MFIAKQKKENNIAEYLLYMWQIEDIIRANSLNIELIRKNIIDQFVLSEDDKKEMKIWYEGLIEMMKTEHIEEKGHLLINRHVVDNLTELHLRLLESPQEGDYIESYYKTLPFIVELRAKNKEKKNPEIETCFSAVYGLLLLRLQQKEISGETQSAIAQISSFLRTLAQKYKDEREGKLDV